MSRDFGPAAEEMRKALERYSRDELVDLMIHLIRIYVMKDTPEEHLHLDVDLVSPIPELERMSFPQLIMHLQMSLDHEELDHFRVDGPNVYVTLGDKEYDILGPGPELSAPPAQEEVLVQQEAPLSFAELAAGAAKPQATKASAPKIKEEVVEPPPRAPFAESADFDLDDDFDEKIAARKRPSKSTTKAGSSRGGLDDLFGGRRTRRRGAKLTMTPPPPPPPIAESAPGDLSEEERTERAASAGIKGSPKRRAGFEDQPPPLSEGDKEIAPSNRFASLELD